MKHILNKISKNTTFGSHTFKLSPHGATLIQDFEEGQTIIERNKKDLQSPISLNRPIKNNTKGRNLFCLTFFDIFKSQYSRTLSTNNDTQPIDINLIDSSKVAFLNLTWTLSSLY